MTLVVDLSTRYTLVGSAGEEKPATKVLSYVSYPISPPGLNFRELSAMPVNTKVKADHLDVVPILTATKEGISFNPETLETFVSFLQRGDTDLILSSPAVVDHKFVSGMAELLFDAGTGFARFLPQDNAVTIAYGCAKVSATTLEVASPYAAVSAVSEGSVIARERTLKGSCDQLIGAAMSKRPTPPPFAYDAKANPFVTQSYLELSRMHEFFERPETLPDGALLKLLPDLPGAVSSVLKKDGVSA